MATDERQVMPAFQGFLRLTEDGAEWESFVEQLFQSAQEAGYDRALSSDWVEVLEAVLPVLRYPCHALHMPAAYMGHWAPESRVVVAGAFQAGDELRRVQHLAREWIALWAPRVERALPPLCNLWVIASERANAYAANVVAQCRNRWQALGLVTAAG